MALKIGQKFGKLTVVEFSHCGNNGNVYFCNCDCGRNNFQVREEWLVNGKTTDCGCSKRPDMIGKRLGRLLVIEKTDMRKNRSVIYKCQCDCGNIIYQEARFLKIGLKSCGCISKERQHFACGTRIYHLWDEINTRCYNKKRKLYYLYGGRGITVCNDWKGNNPKGFSNFYDWAMANGYKEELLPNGRNKWTIDRIDSDKGYSPDNCRFITNEQQQINKRADKLFEYNGEIKTIKQWLKQYYVKVPDYYEMLKIGLNNQQILDFISTEEQIERDKIYYFTKSAKLDFSRLILSLR